MKPSIKKDLVIIVEEEPKIIPANLRFQKFSPASRGTPVYRTQPMIESIKTSTHFKSQSFMECGTPLRKNQTIARMESFELLTQKNNMKVARKLNSPKTSKSLSESKKRLFFISRNRFHKGQADGNSKHLQSKMKMLINKLKKVLSILEQLIADTYLKFVKFTEEFSKKFQKDVKLFTASMMKQQQKWINQTINADRIIQKPAPLCQKFKQIPMLDLSKINETQIETPLTSTNKPQIRRQVQTERNTPKTCQFSYPARTNHKFSAFNETLNKIKRLSFQGSILKL